MKPYYSDAHVRIYNGDAIDVLRSLPDASIHCCVTSPPYWGLRDYGEPGQIGLESTPEEYVARLVEVFREVRRVLRDDGTLWLNLGDSYASGGRDSFGPGTNKGQPKDAPRAPQPPGLKPKDLVGIPWRVAFALQADGWYLRSDIIWAKPNPMPESVRDRPTKAHEYVFLITKSERYYYDADAIAEPVSQSAAAEWYRTHASNSTKPAGFSTLDGNPDHQSGLRMPGWERKESRTGTRNRRSVWSIGYEPYPEAHFATFPPELPTHCIRAGCPEGGTVLDPFAGSGTTLWVAKENGRQGVGIELNAEYCALAARRCQQQVLDLGAA